MRRRFIAIPLDDQHIWMWERGFWVLGRELNWQMTLHGLDEWPELVHAEREAYGWRLVFAWPDQPRRAE